MENNWVLQSEKQSCRANEKPWHLQKKVRAKDEHTGKGVTAKESS